MRSTRPPMPRVRRLVALVAAIAVAATAAGGTPRPVRAGSASCNTISFTTPAALQVHVTVADCGDGSVASFEATASLFRGTNPVPYKEWTMVSPTIATLVDETVNVPAYGSYRLEVAYWDGSGYPHETPITLNVAAGSLTTVSTPATSFRIGSMSPTSFPGVVSWKNTSPNAATSYKVYRRIDATVTWGTPIATVTSGLAAGASASLNVALPPGHSYQFRVIAINGAGPGPESVGRLDAIKGYANQNSGVDSPTSLKFTYTGTWGTSSLSSYWGATSRASKVAGASVSFTFTGSAAAIVVPVGPTRGSFKVYKDGILSTIQPSEYSGTTGYRKVQYVVRWELPGTHTIKIVVKGTAGHPRVDIDGIMTVE